MYIYNIHICTYIIYIKYIYIYLDFYVRIKIFLKEFYPADLAIKI